MCSYSEWFDRRKFKFKCDDCGPRFDELDIKFRIVEGWMAVVCSACEKDITGFTGKPKQTVLDDAEAKGRLITERPI